MKPSAAEQALGGNKPVDPCVEGRSQHKYNPNGICLYCGYENPYYNARKSAADRTSTTSTASRPTSTSSVRRMEPAFSKKEAHDGIVMLLAVGQSLLLARAPELKEDALTPRERILLADALAEEATNSTSLHRWMAKVGKQKKHAKLGMVLMAIALPRLARHGMIPSEGIDDVAEQLASQLETGSSSGPSGSSPTGPDVPWDAVPMAAGGSPFSDRRNGVGEVNLSGVAAESAPLRSDSENQDGRHSVAGTSNGEIPSSHEESTPKPHRVKAGSQADRPEAG
jgi:hypothetical protein